MAGEEKAYPTLSEEQATRVQSSEREIKDPEDKVKKDLTQFSEENYTKLVQKVVDIAYNHLTDQNDVKKGLRNKFTTFFTWLLGVQYAVLVILITLNACIVGFNVSEPLLMTYISSVFVETLGVIIIMVTFAYGNKTENGILEVLKAVVGGYKKYNQTEKKAKDKDGKENIA